MSGTLTTLDSAAKKGLAVWHDLFCWTLQPGPSLDEAYRYISTTRRKGRTAKRNARPLPRPRLHPADWLAGRRGSGTLSAGAAPAAPGTRPDPDVPLRQRSPTW